MSNIGNIFWFFLKLGAFSFGGPNAHIRLMESEIVKKKQYMDDATFQTLKNESRYMPGPTSTQLAMKVGMKLAGFPGLLAAGIGFVLPACFLMLLIALYYKELSQIKMVQPFLYGLKGAVIAILIYTCFAYLARYLRSFFAIGVFLVVTMGTYLGMSPVLLLFLAGAGSFLMRTLPGKTKSASILFFLQSQPGIVVPAIENSQLLVIFAKIGALLIGSGYVMFAYAKMELVDTNILTLDTLLDAIAFALFVPGPLLASVSFLGYLINEWQGALFAILGFFGVTILYAVFGRLVLSRWIQTDNWKSIFNALVVASIGILFANAIHMGIATLDNFRLWSIAILCFLLLLRWPRLNMIWLIILSANLGYLLLHFFPESTL